MSYRINMGTEMTIKRVDGNTLEIEIAGKKAKVLTEDLAAIVSEELPQNRAEELLGSMEEKTISKGAGRFVVKAYRDMKKGEPVIFTVDITRYMDQANKQAEQSRKAGIWMPSFSGIRVNKQGIAF